MTLPEERLYDWRGKAFHLAWKLDRAHSAVHVLGSTLDEGDSRSARRHYRDARKEVVSAAEEVKTLRCEQPPAEQIAEQEVAGSNLVIRGSWSATVALDVMVDAMAVLRVTDEVDDIDVLVGACIDAERAYEDGTAVVEAASKAHGPAALRELERAFDTDGEVALRRRVRADRTAVDAISQRAGRIGRQETGA